MKSCRVTNTGDYNIMKREKGENFIGHGVNEPYLGIISFKITFLVCVFLGSKIKEKHVENY